MKIREQQEEAIAKALTPSGKVFEDAPTTSILTTTLNYSEYDLLSALGPVGVTLKNFAEEVHLLHPGLHTLFSGQLISGHVESFSSVAQEVLKLHKHVEDGKHSRYVESRIKDLIKKHPFYNKIRNSLTVPSQTNSFCRFVEDAGVRTKRRNSYTVKVVNLEPLYKKGKAYWDELPSDFSTIIRHTCPIDDDIKVIETRYAHFKRLGLHSMATEIDKSINKLRDAKDDTTYLGFNRISLHKISGIVAKSLECELGDNCITPKPDEELMTQAQRFATALSVYSPDKHRPPKTIINLVQTLDKAPELRGWPIFDRFVVLRVINDFVGYLKDTELPRILMGEVDNKMYYVAHWYI